MSHVLAPEAELLWSVFREHRLVNALVAAPGGWRTLSRAELARLDCTETEQNGVLALQELVRRSYPVLEPMTLATPADVGAIYSHRLGGARQETLLAVALDAQHRVLEEITLAMGGASSLSLTACDVLRPLIRAGAQGVILVHNHPSGDPTPSEDDVHFTQALAAAAAIVRIHLVDHVIVGGRGGGYVSLLERGVIDIAALSPFRVCAPSRRLSRRSSP